jgi:hypothetical protein
MKPLIYLEDDFRLEMKFREKQVFSQVDTRGGWYRKGGMRVNMVDVFCIHIHIWIEE